MNNRDLNPDNERICSCSGTTVGQIKRLIDRGVTDFEGISNASGAASGCGACDTDILALMAEYVQASARPSGGEA